ncbi:MAG: anthranilate phosphoribosyltransferase [SAR202 cluster bacterium]|nr:anthranilate phosphoribosyltransferase [SAR202 cluster bacterium]
MIRKAIAAAVSKRSLTQEEAATVMREIMEGQATPAQLGAFLTALHLKGETPQEIAGMAAVMREKALPVNVPGPLADTCGTGGDGKNSFNISTAAAFVAAAAGLKVAKHGNRAASGSCGSADVLEALGVKIDLPPAGVERCIAETGMGFMFAPVFHPAMRYAAPVRREIGIRTVFNILGPLTNPARAQHQLLGVAYPHLAQPMAEVLRLLGVRHALVVHSEDGSDELTLAGGNSGWEVKDGQVQPWSVALQSTGLPRATSQDIRGGSKEENAATMRRLFQGKQGPIRNVVLLNSGAVLLAGDKVGTLRQGIDLAARTIDKGAALATLEALAALSQRLGKELA